MKRVFSVLLAVLCAGALTGVAVILKYNEDKAAQKNSEYVLGFGTQVTANTDNEKAVAKETATYIAVITDSDGKITDCTVDCADISVSVDGAVVNKTGDYKTKNELGKDYGMAEYSPIGKEWFEQASYFAKSVIGMDLEGVKAIKVAEGGKAENTDLLAGCTIGISDMKAALVKALEDPKSVKFTYKGEPSVVGVSITDDSQSVDAAEEKEGTVSVVTTFCAMAVGDGKVLGAIIDVANPTFSFSIAGEFTKTSYTGTKRELGADYGMAQYSPIGKEWFEQSEFFCDYIVGKTADEVGATDMGDADLTAGCTIYAGDLIKVAKKAFEGAKGGTYSLGLGMEGGADASKAGKASHTQTVAAVILDSDGKVVSCIIDCMDASLSIEGGVAVKGNDYKTKNELGANYGMAQYSPIGKEWYEQAAFFADTVKGKTLDEVKAIELSDKGSFADADLLAGCTIGAGDIKKAVVEAIENAKNESFSAKGDPVLSLAVMADDSASKDAAGEENGKASITITVCAAVTVDKKAVSAIIDVADPSITFDKAGEIVNVDFAGTKRELGADYGMAQYSPIGKEWFEQSDFFCDYIVGKTADEVGATDMGDADLTAGCTIYAGGLVKIAKKALEDTN